MTILTSEANVKYISPSFSLHLSWNPCKELQTWLVALEYILQELVEFNIKQDSTRK